MDFKKLGQQVGQIQRTAKGKLGDRADPENLKKDAKEFREILAGDGSLADKAKEARQRLAEQPQERAEGAGSEAVDRQPAEPGPSCGEPEPQGNEPGNAQ